MTYQEFKNKYTGKYIDYDGSYGNQCWDLGQKYVTECLKVPASVLSGCGLVSNMLKEPKKKDLLKYFDEVSTGAMQVGDIVIWEYGHIAIFDHWDGKQCWYFSQNPNAPKVITINRGGAHAFRLKSANNSTTKPTPAPKLNLKYKVGDVMLFTGRLYEKADGTGAGATRNSLKCTITKTYNESGTTKPYNINNGLGWVAESDLKPYTNSTNSTTELKVGDKVKIIGTGNGSADGDKNTAGGIGWERYVLKIYSGKPYPYQVGSNGVTIGFYKSSALEKK